MKTPGISFVKRKFPALALIFTLVILTFSTQDARAADIPLKVVGRFLQDANGNNIMMRGVNIPIYKSGWANDLNNVAAAVATTKVNVARLEWWAIPDTGTTQYTTANLDRAIQKYFDLGILPIIELHDLTFQYGHDAKTGPYSDGNDQTIFANTITNFWTRSDILPILIKHQGHLVINLANEWGTSTYSDGSSARDNFINNYTNAITTMRAAGINAPLMIDAPKGFDYQFILDHGQALLDADPQDNTMLSIHAYWAASQLSDANVNTILNNIKNSGLPIILGEVSSNAWTTIQCDPVNYANLLTSANNNQIGYLFWAWYEDGTCGPKMNMTVNANGVTVPTAANPGFGYNALNGSGYGINTALPTTTQVITSAEIHQKTLTTGRAIATWPGGIPGGEKRPVLVFLPGWGGTGPVDAFVNSLNLTLVDHGYVTLAIGFDSSSEWNSDIELKTLQGLNKLCTDAAIPANCNAITLIGGSYGGAQNYWVIEYLLNHQYDGVVGSKGKAVAFLSADAGYGAPGTLDDPNTGAYTRTGLADTSSYSVAMIENMGDSTFPVDECTWGNCGARVLSNAHLARGDQNVFSICPPGGEHGTRGFTQWVEWIVSATKKMIHESEGIPTFTGYTPPTMSVENTCISQSFISGNTGAADVTLSYTDGVAKTATSQVDGSYSLSVSSHWDGTVTPSHACYTFTPASRNYNDVTSDQTGQNYTPTFVPASGCADIDVRVGDNLEANSGLLPGSSTRQNYIGVNDGPVNIVSLNDSPTIPIIAAERVLYNVNGINTSFSEMMGLPTEVLTTEYWLPWYNNVTLDTQLRLANTSTTTSTQVSVYIADEFQGSFDLDASESIRQSFPGINNGPVEVISDTTNIIVSERVLYKVNGVDTSFSEMTALPKEQLSNEYWLPWYNNVTLDTQLRFANTSTTTPTQVSVYIADEFQGSFNLAASQSTRQSFPGINNGPVKVVSDTTDIIVSERVLYNVNGVDTSFSEEMALPEEELSNEYWMPWYNNIVQLGHTITYCQHLHHNRHGRRCLHRWRPCG